MRSPSQRDLGVAKQARCPAPWQGARICATTCHRDQQLFDSLLCAPIGSALLYCPYVVWPWNGRRRWVRNGCSGCECEEAEEAHGGPSEPAHQASWSARRWGPGGLWPHALRAAAQADGGHSRRAIGMAVNEELPMVASRASSGSLMPKRSLVCSAHAATCEAGVPPDFGAPSLWSAANLPVMEWACGDVGGSNGSTPLGGSRNISMIENWRAASPAPRRVCCSFHRPYCLKIDSDTLGHPGQQYRLALSAASSGQTIRGYDAEPLWLKPSGGSVARLRRRRRCRSRSGARRAGCLATCLHRTRERSRRAATASNIAGSSSSSNGWAFAGVVQLVSRDAVRMLVESRYLLAMGQTELVRGEASSCQAGRGPPHGRGRAFLDEAEQVEDATLGFCYGSPACLSPTNAIFPHPS